MKTLAVRKIVREEIRNALKDLGIAPKFKKCDWCHGANYLDEPIRHEANCRWAEAKERIQRDIAQGVNP